MLYTFDLSKHVVHPPNKNRITIGALFVVFIGLILLVSDFDNPKVIAASISCLFPIYHFSLFRFMHKVFVKKYQREPVNTTFNWSPNIYPDRVFALSFFFISVFSSFALIAPILWGTAKTWMHITAPITSCRKRLYSNNYAKSSSFEKKRHRAYCRHGNAWLRTVSIN